MPAARRPPAGCPSRFPRRHHRPAGSSRHRASRLSQPAPSPDPGPAGPCQGRTCRAAEHYSLYSPTRGQHPAPATTLAFAGLLRHRRTPPRHDPVGRHLLQRAAPVCDPGLLFIRGTGSPRAGGRREGQPRTDPEEHREPPAGHEPNKLEETAFEPDHTCNHYSSFSYLLPPARDHTARGAPLYL